MTDPIKQMVLKHSDAGEIARAAATEGMRFMHDDGLRKAVAGETTIEEVCRVTQKQLHINQLSQDPVTHSATNTPSDHVDTATWREFRLGALLHWFKRRQSALSGFVRRK